MLQKAETQLWFKRENARETDCEREGVRDLKLLPLSARSSTLSDLDMPG